VAARKGKTFDVVRFASDRQFAAQTLSQVLAGGDEELTLAGLSLMDLLGLTQAPAPASAAAPAGRRPARRGAGTAAALRRPAALKAPTAIGIGADHR
jgi:hypothetical protein